MPKKRKKADTTGTPTLVESDTSDSEYMSPDVDDETDKYKTYMVNDYSRRYPEDSPNGSYHLPTLTKYNFDSIVYSSFEYSNISPHANLKLVDWKFYQKNADEMLSGFVINCLDPISSYNNFCSIILEAVNKSITYKAKLPTVQHACDNNIDCFCHKHVTINKNVSNLRKRKPLAWWNDKCAKAVDTCKQSYIVFKSNPTTENFINFKRSQALKKKNIKI
ncbi:hypothetical protein ACJJTC_001812 [Scirpophaga incertulas]